MSAVELVWWVGLAGALAGTLVVLKQAFLLLRTLRDLDALAGMIAAAARGVSKNVEGTRALPAASAPAQQLAVIARDLAASGKLFRDGLKSTPPEGAGR
jgi:hypothetical protein